MWEPTDDINDVELNDGPEQIATIPVTEKEAVSVCLEGDLDGIAPPRQNWLVERATHYARDFETMAEAMSDDEPYREVVKEPSLTGPNYVAVEAGVRTSGMDDWAIEDLHAVAQAYESIFQVLIGCVREAY